MGEGLSSLLLAREDLWLCQEQQWQPCGSEQKEYNQQTFG